MYDENTIIRDARVLKQGFIPSRVVHRDGQLDAMRSCVKPVLKDMEPRSIFIWGVPGTGKTCLSRYVSEELSAYSASVQSSYINCWECSSRFKILYSILQDMGLTLSVHRKGTPTDELLDSLRKRLKERYCVIILDEVDKLEDDRVLYDLSTSPGACLVMLSNSETSLHGTDPRVRSRLASAEHIEFPAYKDDEIIGILRDRREWGLLPGVISNSQLERIASASGGDSRLAIDTLRIVAEDAENQDLEKIPDRLIEKALPRAAQNSTERNLGMLAPHQKLILGIMESGPMDGGELFRRFTAMAKAKGVDSVVDRTFRNYLDRLVRAGLVKSEGDSRWRKYSLAEK